MADLVTHACSALLPGAFVRSRLVPLVTVGTVLPDLFGRAVPLALERLPVPEEVVWPWGALHEPAGWLLVCLGAALAFVERDRRRALLALMLGCALHTALDLTQFHHGEGYPVLAPFSLVRFELGWIGSEATVPLALPLLVLTGLAWLPRARRLRESSLAERSPMSPPSLPQARAAMAAPSDEEGACDRRGAKPLVACISALARRAGLRGGADRGRR